MRVTWKRVIVCGASISLCISCWVAFAQTEDVNKKDVEYSSLTTRNAEGKVVQEPEVHLHKPERTWRIGEPVILKTTVRNEGNRKLSFVLNKEGRTAQLEVNGLWYEFAKTSGYCFKDGYVSGAGGQGGIQLPFGPGQQHADLKVVVADSWFRIPKGKAAEHATRLHGGAGWAVLDYAKQRTGLLLMPGRYRIRIAYTCPGAYARDRESVRVVSNPIEVEIVDSANSNFTYFSQVVKPETNRLLEELVDLERSHLEIKAAKRLFVGVDHMGRTVDPNESSIEEEIELRLGRIVGRLTVFGESVAPLLHDKLQELPATYLYTRRCVQEILNHIDIAAAVPNKRVSGV